MTSFPAVTTIAFDMYSTLAQNETVHWQAVFDRIAAEERLPVDGQAFYEEWRSHEVNFRKTRTNMQDPAASPPFMTYYDAWSQAFEKAFAVFGIRGRPRDASRQCIESLGQRQAFPDAGRTLTRLAARFQLGVVSNADDGFLGPVMATNGWTSGQNGWRFQAVVSSESARAYKPDPRIFDDFCRAAAVQPHQVLYVGDSPYDDAHGAKLAGMQAVLIRRDDTNPGRTPPPETGALVPPDFTVDSLEELGDLLLR